MPADKKENQRIALTKSLLKAALIRLLKTKNIYKISIRELCEEASINRSTFYKYYGSQFDLLTDMENDIIDMIKDALTNSDIQDKYSLGLLCGNLEENIELARMLINNNVDPLFPEKIFALPQVRQTIETTLGEGRDEAEFEYIYNYITYGSFQILKIWINKDMRESPEVIADLILNMNGMMM